jgi:enamine deaminase RidA (YjgF/YER057c/UK114 family)
MAGESIRGQGTIVHAAWQPFFESTGVPAAIRVGDQVHVTGSTGDRPDGTFSEDAREQIRQAFENIGAALAEAGASWTNVVSMTTYHVSLRAQASIVLEVAAEFMDPPYPAWTAVGVTELWEADAMIEISCVAVVQS